MEKRHVAAKHLKSVHNNKLICEEENQAFEEHSRIYVKPLDDTDRNIHVKAGKKRLVISIKQKPPVVKTLYKAEEDSEKISSTNDSRLAIGDHLSSTSHEYKKSKNNTSTTTTTSISVKQDKHKIYQYKNTQVESTSLSTDNSDSVSQVSTEKGRKKEPCSVYARSPQIMTFRKIEDCKAFRNQQNPDNKESTAKLVHDQTSPTTSELQNLYKKINYLEEKIFEQEMVLRSIHKRFAKSSCVMEESRDNEPYNERACCSYIEYSHIPGTSAFQKQSQQSNPGQENTGRKHHAEKYGRDLTLYDNVTARGRRQTASVPGKRNDLKHAADKVHKIRHKLNPVRDYRLMDTVHYLAQGEFAPRDDGIKLTPSREAVLSDIIWEDVCRTHWPNTRLARQHRERTDRRSDLQNLIDSLLRERVAHVERKRRRHYRIVKLNHRHDTVRALGKIGDIIVASNKHGQHSKEQHPQDNKGSQSPSKSPRSKERLARRSSHERDSPGPSHSIRKEPMYCYRAGNSQLSESSHIYYALNQKYPEGVSTSSVASKAPRFVAKKKSSDVRHHSDVHNLDHFILLPTLVLRTPSNLKRQKKFNELYHKILNTQMQKDRSGVARKHNDTSNLRPLKKDIGLNIDINVSESDEKLLKSEEL
ncbi:uncharacterized protein LOC121733273 [Aricia agestis]|uniref:uncharacterized protein LOC121733273 n=1 Tax=Aricia agestis TaxID=91739 RepID=UPI001C20AC57|nr:uncharacterized protein LOC121733273 [Aricia agestis]